MSSAETTPACEKQTSEKWEDGGYKQGVLDETRDWVLKQPDTSAVAFVMFSYGTIVYVTEAMAKSLEGADASYIPPLPGIPASRCRGDRGKFVEERQQYVADTSRLMPARDLLLYRAAVRYLAMIGYPTPGVNADHLIHLRDGGMWTAQYRDHRHAIMYMPKSLDIPDGRTACSVVKDMGLRLDQMTLVPAFIHDGAYDTVDRSIDPKTWDNPFKAGIYDDPKTVGLRVFTASPDPMVVLRVFTASPDPMVVLQAMFGGLKA